MVGSEVSTSKSRGATTQRGCSASGGGLSEPAASLYLTYPLTGHFKSPRAPSQNSSGIERFQSPFWQIPGLVFFLQLHHNNLDRFITGVDVGVRRVGRVCGEPVSFAGFPDVRLRGTVLFDDLHGPARQRHDDARMFVPVHGEGCVWKNHGLPYLHVII